MHNRYRPARALFVLLALCAGTATASTGADCHPLPTPGLAQYIVGYGSLMEEASRLRTAPSAKEARPVRVQGFRRAWIGKAPVGFGTTFLGITVERSATLNAALFALADDIELVGMDQREASYCRVAVRPEQIAMLTQAALPQGEIWIYVTKADKVAPPSAGHPIVQSYVDLFLNGCLQIERKYQIDGFTEECIATTHGWSRHWVNDRLYPRRPFIHEPNAGAIDALLQRRLPGQFKAIRIE